MVNVESAKVHARVNQMYVSQSCLCRYYFNRYTFHYRRSFAFYILLFPTLISISYETPACADILAVGEWSGLPRSPFRINSLFRLHLSPGGYRSAAVHSSTGRTNHDAILARANKCRRPIKTYEGSIDDSLKLAMQILSLAS